MKIALPEIFQTFYSAEFLFFYRPRYNPLPLLAGLISFGLIVSFVTLPFVRAAGSDNQKKTAFAFYVGAGVFALLYGVFGLLYAAFVRGRDASIQTVLEHSFYGSIRSFRSPCFCSA